MKNKNENKNKKEELDIVIQWKKQSRVDGSGYKFK